VCSSDLGAGIGAVGDDQQGAIGLLVVLAVRIVVLPGPEIVDVQRVGARCGVDRAPEARGGAVGQLVLPVRVHLLRAQRGPVARAGDAGVVDFLEVGVDVASSGGDHGDVGGALDHELALLASHVQHTGIDDHGGAGVGEVHRGGGLGLGCPGG